MTRPKPSTCDSCNRTTHLLIWWPGDRWYCPRCDVERIQRGEEFKVPDKYIRLYGKNVLDKPKS